MKIKLIEFGGKHPVRKHLADAGADVYATKDTIIDANSVVKIPLGFGISLPDGYMGLVMPRSSMAVKGLTAEMPPIDSSYTGEINAIITNNTDEDLFVAEGDRIAQLVIVPIIIPDFITEEEFDGHEKRGANGFGSTGV